MTKSIVVRVAELLGDEDKTKVENNLKIALDYLLKNESSTNNFKFSIRMIPSCDDVDKSEDEGFVPPWMALVYFTSDNGSLPSFLQACKDGWISVPWIDNSVFNFDCSFIGFTQLYPTAPGKIAADIIALTGLNAHAFGSWRGASGSMWLQDFLPRSKSFPNCRTMIYGYNAKFDTPGTHTILDFARDLMEGLGRIRLTKEEKARPIIFLGHSLGGLVITHCLVEAKDQMPELLKATRGLLFFGAPHLGMEVEDFKLSLNETNPRQELIESINAKGQQLEDRMARFKDIIHLFKVPVVSFCEKIQTKQLERNQDTGTLGRTGQYSLAVRQDSSTLQLLHTIERTIPLDKDHSTLVKYASLHDNDYRKVFKALNDTVGSAVRNVESTTVIVESPLSNRPTPFSIQTHSVQEVVERPVESPSVNLLGKNPESKPIHDDTDVSSSIIDSGPYKEKTLIVYHSTDDVRKRLRAPIKVLFTLTPDPEVELPVSYSTIAWKVLDFPHFNTRDSKTLTLYKHFGFALMVQDEDGIVEVSARDLSVIVPWKHRAVLSGGGDWPLELTVDPNTVDTSRDSIGIFNDTDFPASLALCMIDGTDPEALKCFPLAALGQLDPGENIQCPIPFLLQSFAASKHQGQIVDLSQLKNHLFKGGMPYDIRSADLPEKSTHRLYSQATGKNVLELIPGRRR